MITPTVLAMSERRIRQFRLLPLRAAFVLLSMLAVSACTVVSRPDPGATDAAMHGPWQTTVLADHPLVGRIWQQDTGDFISSTALADALAEGDVILLGEKHDNGDHHRLRLALLEKLLARRSVSVLALEMLTDEQLPLQEGDTLHEQLQWDDGWHWPFYQPVLERALSTPGIQLRSANITREQVMAVYAGDLSDETKAATEQALNEVQFQALNQDIDISHCGLLPDSQFEAMVRVQQVRDHTMARALNRSADDTGNGLHILLAGNYHIRHDTGVPNYLPAADTRPITVAFLEVAEDKPHPADYQQAIANIPAWDYIWFTPALTTKDYCELLTTP